MQAIFLYTLLALSAVYLVSLLFCKQGIFQAIAKACLAPLVFAVYAAGANTFFVPVALALLFGWLGDIFLLKIENIRFFKLGLTAFLLGHICYISAMLYFVGSLNRFALIISLLAAFGLGFAMRRLVRPSRELGLSTVAYEVVILLMAVSALQLFLARGAPSGALVFTGSLCFLASDSLLACFTFHTKPRCGNFLVMITYIAAQLLIALGLAGF